MDKRRANRSTGQGPQESNSPTAASGSFSRSWTFESSFLHLESTSPDSRYWTCPIHYMPDMGSPVPASPSQENTATERVVPHLRLQVSVPILLGIHLGPPHSILTFWWVLSSLGVFNRHPPCDASFPAMMSATVVGRSRDRGFH